MKVGPGARRFLEQRKAQGKHDLTDAQADRLAVLMSPVRVAGVQPLVGAGDASPRVVPAGELAEKGSAA